MKKDILDDMPAWFESLPKDHLVKLMVEYVGESQHQGWPGYLDRDITALRRFFKDLKVFYEEPGYDWTK